MANGIGQIWRGTRAGEKYVSSTNRFKRSLQVAVLATACPVLFAGAGVAAAPALAATGTRPAVTAGTWGNAEEVPGIEALNTGNAEIDAMSCPSAGNCSAGGSYLANSNIRQLFVVNETNGVWGTAMTLPGITALNTGGPAVFGALSCASAGNCSAGGRYRLPHGRQPAWAATETDGVWGAAVRVPGLDRLGTGKEAGIDVMSCTAPGNCSAGGSYKTSDIDTQPFVVNERNGKWHAATAVAGLAAMEQGQGGALEGLSCGSPGNCTAGGFFGDPAGGTSLFVVSEKAGTWQQATRLPGIDSLRNGGFAEFRQISCTSAGNCSAGGDVTPSGLPRAFVATETGGTWGTAQAVPGLAATAQSFSEVNGLSCTSAGNCLAVGTFSGTAGSPSPVFAVIEKKGAWGSAKPVPGVAALANGGSVFVTSVSCGAPGDCSFGGIYVIRNRGSQAFIASEVNGHWITVEQVPGTAALNTGNDAGLGAVSCGAAGNCGAGGSYAVSLNHQEPFVANES